VSDRLAIEGGKPTRDLFLPYARQTIEEDDVHAVVEALRSDWLTTGPRVEELERAFADYVGSRFAVAYSSGTAALHGTTYAAGLGPGDEVIVPAMTFAASAACAAYVGARPVLADVEADTLNLDPAEFERQLTGRTKAVIAVHYAGVPAEMSRIRGIAAQAGLTVIEDAAHAAGAEAADGRCGTLGEMAVFSLHPAKQLTAGEGGIVTTSDPELEDRLRRFRNHCMDTSGREREQAGAFAYAIEELGFNYRLTDIQAALGTSQLAKLDRFVERRRKLVERYDDSLQGLAVDTPVTPFGTRPSWHLYVIQLRLEELDANRDEIYRALRAENIGVNVHYIPVHHLGFYSRLLGKQQGDFPRADRAYSRILTLPLFPAMSDTDVDTVATALKKVLGRHAKRSD
jgi:perosamine synthetase